MFIFVLFFCYVCTPQKTNLFKFHCEDSLRDYYYHLKLKFKTPRLNTHKQTKVELKVFDFESKKPKPNNLHIIELELGYAQIKLESISDYIPIESYNRWGMS